MDILWFIVKVFSGSLLAAVLLLYVTLCIVLKGIWYPVKGELGIEFRVIGKKEE